MLEDRSYMREEPFRRTWPLTTVLMVVNAAIFVLQEINAAYIHLPVDEYLALSHTGLQAGYVWQLFTFQFLHAGLWHLLFNLIWSTF